MLWNSNLPGSEVPNAASEFEIHRVKGRIRFKDGSIKLIQGVRDVFEILDANDSATEAGAPPAEQDAVRKGEDLTVGKLVLIGRGLDRDKFSWSLNFMLQPRQ